MLIVGQACVLSFMLLICLAFTIVKRVEIGNFFIKLLISFNVSCLYLFLLNWVLNALYKSFKENVSYWFCSRGNTFLLVIKFVFNGWNLIFTNWIKFSCLYWSRTLTYLSCRTLYLVLMIIINFECLLIIQI